jgi:hypothetical protein
VKTVCLDQKKRWEEELHRKIDLEEIISYVKKAKNGKAVGVDGYPMEFWKELGKRENTSRILVKIMNKIYEIGEVPTGWKTSMYTWYTRGRGIKKTQQIREKSHYCQQYQRYIHECWPGD